MWKAVQYCLCDPVPCVLWIGSLDYLQINKFTEYMWCSHPSLNSIDLSNTFTESDFWIWCGFGAGVNLCLCKYNHEYDFVWKILKNNFETGSKCSFYFGWSETYVAAASVLPEISEFRERVPGHSGNRFQWHSSHIRDEYRYGIPVTGYVGFVRMEDMAASGYYQNTISRMGGHDLLSQK